MKIIEYRDCRNIKVLFPEYNWIIDNIIYSNFKSGNIKCPYEPRTYKHGYIGEGKYKPKEIYKCYRVWSSMLMRCYDNKVHEKEFTYKDCEVCEEWLNFQNFAEWYEKNYYEIPNEKMQLDKDILIKGNKLYSPETCVFVNHEINSLFTKSNKARGKYPIGVRYCKRDKKFTAYVTINKKEKSVAYCDDPIQAFNCYKQAKENYIKEVADKYKQWIPNKLYDAMYRYEVEITD